MCGSTVNEHADVNAAHRRLNCVEPNADANIQRAHLVPSFLISVPQSKLEQIALVWFLRQPEGAAQTRDPSCVVSCRDMAAVSFTSTQRSKNESKRNDKVH